MCGICGIAAADPDRVPIEPARLRAMTDAIRHRGPDDRGEHLEPGIALGMRRLSIIDVAHGGQPSVSEDGSLLAVHNGEIYNHRDLFAELRGHHELRSHCDTEVIVHLYEESGVEFPRRLAGMYAIALWDRPRRRLVLVRDRMGIKPLYVAELADGLAFASEVKALVAGGLIEPALDPVGAELFMAYGYVPGPHTLFAGVRKLMPGSLLAYEDGRITTERSYWHPWEEVPERPRNTSWQEDTEELLAILRRSVREHMISDVPLGLMLSGGVDSSLVGALMAEASAEPIKTFSIGFANRPESNELADARAVAQRLGSDHHELVAELRDDPAALEDMLWHIEEPITDLSALGFQLISQLARKHVTVALSGQGADELFGGYRKHQVARGADLVGRLPGARIVAGRLAVQAAAGSTAARGLHALATTDPVRRLQAMSRVTQADERLQLLQPEFRSSDAEEVLARAIGQYRLPDELSALEQTLELDRRLALVDLMFLYFDKMSMAASLEVRVPFVDHRLVTFSLALPDSRRLHLLRRKEVLRRAARGLVDESVLQKRKTGFFNAALEGWLSTHREGFVREVLLDSRTRARGQFEPAMIESMVSDAGAAGRKRAQVLFAALMLELWQRLWVDGDIAGRLRVAELSGT
ncbi:MAG TPA: asparagine synthase (glutamine-hydrolyzing) [Solirubrobacteraceae bacterium]|nr:asparagine synthase (glutamine-hydrolyzing) [Solirubrobacteraceae bacterium]